MGHAGRVSLLLAGATVIGCATTIPPAGAPLSPASSPNGAGVPAVANAASFDHGCPPEQIRVIRADASSFESANTIDLDVCGAVRRYKAFKVVHPNGMEWIATWLDATSLYPASSLPAPLPKGK